MENGEGSHSRWKGKPVCRLGMLCGPSLSKQSVRSALSPKLLGEGDFLGDPTWLKTQVWVF